MGAKNLGTAYRVFKLGEIKGYRCKYEVSLGNRLKNNRNSSNFQCSPNFEDDFLS
jgi:hypothetical protein